MGGVKGNAPGEPFRLGEDHFLVVPAGSVFVLGIGIETLATWFTADMRDARALGLARGGRTTAAKSSAMHASRTPQRVFLFIMFGIWDLRCSLLVLRS